jgi:4-diphosphocytidyl-2-C-methyl-D-erythritol kinase
VRLYAPAKINWTLEVLGRRDDGYHEVRTVIQTVDLCDTLEIGRGRELQLAVEGPHETSEDDLVLRAAALLAQGAARGARIRLSKRIPVSAGLGGGSSDTAAALRGLNQLWGLGHGDAELAEMGARLGSDVPFFLHGGAALAEGRGERITPLPDAPSVWLVLLAPPFQMLEKTKRMYAALTPADFTNGSHADALVRRIRDGHPVDDGALYNAFQDVAYQVFEGLSAYRDALLAAGARRVHLAGSGPALFALGPDEEAARAVYARLRPPAGKAFVVRTLTAAEAPRTEA